MLKRRIQLFCLLSFIHSVTIAQQWRTANITGSFMEYAFPFSKFTGLFVSPLHLKGSIGVTWQWNKNAKHQLLQDAAIGFGYHRFIQSIIPLNTEIGYRYQSTHKIFMNIFIGAGYLHSIPLVATYVLRNGAYEKTNRLGRPQGMINARVGIGYQFTKNSSFEISYENLLQIPFVKKYVTFLPYNIINVTYAMPLVIFKHKTDHKKVKPV